MRIKRLLSLCVCFSCMLCAVIFSRPSVALADEGEEFSVVSLEGTEYTVQMTGTDDSYDYQGATTMSVSNALGIVRFTNMLGQQLSTKNGFVTFDLDVPVTFSLAVERGYTYSGQIEFPVKIDLKDVDDASWNYRYWRFNLSDVVEISDYENITVSYRNYTNINTTFEYGDVQLWLVFTLDNYQPSFTGNLYFNTMLHFESTMQVQSSIPANNTAIPALNLTATVPSDWAGSLYEYPTQVITDSTGSLITNQTQQQQQIAQQQQQQSQQQHEEMTEKVEESTNIIDKGLDRLGNTILDGIKSFFIPSSEYFTALFDDLKVWFEERMGLLSAPLVFLLDILGMFTGSVPMGEITLPAIGFGDIWISQPMTFRLSDYPVIETLQGYCHIATNIMMTLWVIELFQKKEKEVLHS